MREDNRREDEYASDDDGSAYRQALQDQLAQSQATQDDAAGSGPTEGVTDPDQRDAGSDGGDQGGGDGYNHPDDNGGVLPGDTYAGPPAVTGGGLPAWQQPWAPGSSQPTSAPPGQHWDATYANFVPDAAPAGSGGPSTTRPTGGQLTDPAYAAQYVAWAGTQPGVNPSVKNDPNYWIGRFTSGAFLNDQDYALKRMMQPEGAPEGAGAPNVPARTTSPYVPSNIATANVSSGNGSSAPQVAASNPNSAFGDSIRQQLLALLGQAPVSENDPDIAGAISSNRVAQERSLAQERDQIAESANAQHLGSAGSTQAQIQAARERTGASEGQFSGNLVAQQALARRNQITQLMQIGAGVMTADQQQQLQRELANIDAQLRQQSITNQNTQFNDQLGVNVGEFQANLNRQSVLDAMGVHI